MKTLSEIPAPTTSRPSRLRQVLDSIESNPFFNILGYPDPFGFGFGMRFKQYKNMGGSLPM